MQQDLINLYQQIKNKIGENENTENWKFGLFHRNVFLKKYALMKIVMFFSSQKIPYDSQYLQLINIALTLHLALDQESIKRIQQKASQYFYQKIKSISKIQFKEKQSGVQFGRIINIFLEDGKQLKYYAKTHRGGQLIQSMHTSLKSVDLKELFIYKILQNCGFGTEVLFFYDDLKNFYIATKDASYDYNNEKGEFVTFDSIRKKSLNRIQWKIKHQQRD